MKWTKLSLAFATIVSIVSALAVPSAMAQAKKPNTLVIMTDYVGVWNISAYHRGMMGGRTPNMDRIANEGAPFTDNCAQRSCTAGSSASGCRGRLSECRKKILQSQISSSRSDTPPLKLARITSATETNSCPIVHGFDEFYASLYYLNAEEEPDYPKNPAFHEKFGPHGVFRCVALTSDNTAAAELRFGEWGKQKCEDTGPLTRKRMETVEEDLLQVSLDFMDKSAKSGKPFFLWHNTSRMHVWTHLSPQWQNKSGYGPYADGMMELDWVVGELLKKLDDLGIANTAIVALTSDNGADIIC
jgi:arylsulfatase A-like enzyme